MADQRHDGEFHRADPAWRRRMQLLLAAAVLLGAGALVALQMWLGGLRANGGDIAAYQRAIAEMLAGLGLVLAFVAAVFSAWLFRVAAATRAERRWPPSSMRTFSDVRIRYLTSADALVTQMKSGAIGLALLALGLAAWGAWLLRST
jgi:hypothetical protein